MTIELEQITGDDDATGGEGEGPGESASEQLATAERLDAELRGSLGGASDDDEQAAGETAEGGEAGTEAEADQATEKPAGEKQPADDDKKGDRGAWRWKGIRQKEQQLAQQQAELQATYQQLQQQQAAAQEYQEAAARIKQLAATSPRAAAREFARMTGQPADDLYQGWTEERLKGGTEAEHDKLSQVPPAVRQLLDEQAEQIRQLKEGHEKFTQTAQEMRAAELHQQDCSLVLGAATTEDPENGYVLPYLATMPGAVRETYVSQAVSMAVELQQADGVARDHAWVAKRLDGVRRQELQDQLSALPVSALQALLPAGLNVVNSGGTSQDPVNPAGDATGRTLGSKRGGKRSPGNRAGAQSSTGARPEQSRAERLRALDEDLRASISRD